MTAQLPVSKCDSCGESNDAATHVYGDHSPKPGDWSICFYCGHLAMFGPDMQLRALTGREIIDAALNTHLVHTIQMIKRRKR